MTLEESSAHLIVGLAQMEQGHPEQALTSLRAAHEIRSRLPNHELEQATTLANLGFAHLQLGQADQALDAYKAALERYQVAGDRVGEGVVLDKLCGLHWTRGELERSKWYGCRALEAHRRAGNQRFEAIALGNLGTLFQELGELTEAAIYFEQAQDLHEAQGNRIGLCVTAAYLGSLATERENWEEATAHLDRALRLARALGAPPLQARALLEWGAMELAAGKLDIADALLAEASQLARDTNRQGLLLAVQGLTASQRGRADVACARLEEAKAIADTLGTRPTSRLGRLIGELRAACESSPSTTPGTGPG
jgi:tetratricopeptide (TPR) repeat protein